MVTYRYKALMPVIKYLHVAFFVASVSTCFAQNTERAVFKIVSSSEGARLDGQQIDAPVNVYANNQHILIPKSGYVAVITNEGYAFRLTKSRKVSSVNSFVRKKITNPSGILGLSAVNRYVPDEIRIMGKPSYQFSNFLGDSLFITWIDKSGSRGSYRLCILTMDDDTLSSKKINRHWDVVPVSEFFKLNFVILYGVENIKRENVKSSMALVRRPGSYEYKSYDLNLLQANATTAEQKVMQIAIYETEYLVYDHLFLLYKWVAGKSIVADDIYNAYLQRKIKEYHLDSLDLN